MNKRLSFGAIKKNEYTGKICMELKIKCGKDERLRTYLYMNILGCWSSRKGNENYIIYSIEERTESVFLARVKSFVHMYNALMADYRAPKYDTTKLEIAVSSIMENVDE